MKRSTSARSAELSSRSRRRRRRRPTRNKHNLLPMKKNQPGEVGQKVLLVRSKGLPVDQAGRRLEGAEDDEPRKAWSKLGKAWIEPRKVQSQRKSEHSKQNREHRKDKRVGNAGRPVNGVLGNQVCGIQVFPQTVSGGR
jgi:hypothetical protein